RNNGDGTFTDVSRQTGLIADGFVKGAVWGDINNNGLQDLYVSRMGEPNLLFVNQGPDEHGRWTFAEQSAQAGVGEPMASFTSWFWDFNQNGFEDLFVSGYFMDPGDTAREYLGMQPLGERPRLYRNNGDGTFTDITQEAGLWKLMYTMGANFGDFNNSGYPDMYLGTGDPDLQALMPNRAFLNQGDGRFAEVTLQSRLGHLQKGHAVSFADFNHNGRADIHANIGGALEGDNYMNAFFVNQAAGENWISLELRGRESNRAGLGARIRVEAEEEPGFVRFTTVRSGGSFGASPLRQHVGLAGYSGSIRAEVRWPSGQVTVHEGLAPRQHWLLDENGDAQPLNRPAFAYRSDGQTGAAHGNHAGHGH
ncbi:MAG: CRTAC1 family protein, partial [Candidatus Cyclonatronum sp.]|uniref:CRTAC1 family protein n=1 Tax=Cyclonatronum sp. TaxID=3024185 RepID=UPI0025B898AA